MPFGRSRNPFERRGSVERLVGRTRDRLAVFTLLLVIAMVFAAGLVTAAAAVRAMDASVDRTLRESAAAMMAGLVPESDEPAASAGPSSSSGDESADSASDGNPAPSISAAPRQDVTPTPTAAVRPTPPARPPSADGGDDRNGGEASPTALAPRAMPHGPGSP